MRISAAAQAEMNAIIANIKKINRIEDRYFTGC